MPALRGWRRRHHLARAGDAARSTAAAASRSRIPRPRLRGPRLLRRPGRLSSRWSRRRCRGRVATSNRPLAVRGPDALVDEVLEHLLATGHGLRVDLARLDT